MFKLIVDSVTINSTTAALAVDAQAPITQPAPRIEFPIGTRNLVRGWNTLRAQAGRATSREAPPIRTIPGHRRVENAYTPDFKDRQRWSGPLISKEIREGLAPGANIAGLMVAVATSGFS